MLPVQIFLPKHTYTHMHIVLSQAGMKPEKVCSNTNAAYCLTLCYGHRIVSSGLSQSSQLQVCIQSQTHGSGGTEGCTETQQPAPHWQHLLCSHCREGKATHPAVVTGNFTGESQPVTSAHTWLICHGHLSCRTAVHL